jgi:hypothetical protein
MPAISPKAFVLQEGIQIFSTFFKYGATCLAFHVNAACFVRLSLNRTKRPEKILLDRKTPTPYSSAPLPTAGE